MNGKTFKKNVILLLIIATSIIFSTLPASAHCDSWDGPLIKDALKAIGIGKVAPVMKWIDEKHEQEIITLFNKTVSLKGGDKEIYAIVEKHFLETLVRLHREGEGAPFTGLKPAGSVTPIIAMADQAVTSGEPTTLITKLDDHLNKVLKEKYDLVMEKSRRRDDSAAEGRDYVKAYVEYTHFLEAIHGILEGGGGHEGH